MMQNSSDTSKKELPVISFAPARAQEDTAPNLAIDSIAIKRKAQEQAMSYRHYLARKAEQDSIQKAEDSLRADSIGKLVKKFEQELQKTYSSIPAHSSKYYQGEAKTKSSIWVFGSLLGFVLLIAILYSRYRKRIDLLIKCLLNWKLGKQVIRYEQVYSHPVNIILLIVFVAGLSIFVLHLFSPFKLHESNKFTAFALTSLAFVVVYFTKIICLILVGKIFQITEATKEYIFHALLLLKFCGIMLVPILILMFYSNLAVTFISYLGLAIIFLSFFMRIYRGVLIGLQLHERALSIILYLCTLEILPALVIAELLNDLYFS